MTSDLILILSLCLLMCIPGGIAFGATTALFVRPRLILQWNPGRVVLFLFMVWAGIGVVLSPWMQLALFGSEQRIEGYMTWLVLAAVAMMAWEADEPDYIRWSLWLSVVGLSVANMLGMEPKLLTPVAFAALFAVGAGFFATRSALFACFCVMGAAFCGMRVGVAAALVAIVAVWLAKGCTKRQFRLLLGVVLALLVALPFTPAGKKLASIDFSTLGTGARTQLVNKSLTLAQERPFLGYGMDCGSKVLGVPSANVAQTGASYDRCHYGPMDWVLQVGFVGLSLLLAATGWVLACAFRFPTPYNLSCLGMVVAWWTFSLLNPPGIPATLMFLVGVIGAKEEK